MGRENYHLFGVCDGHGVNGHLVSNFVKKQLPSKSTPNLRLITFYLENIEELLNQVPDKKSISIENNSTSIIKCLTQAFLLT